ncbi:MAG: hypothetical protein WKF59_17590 [Chitinophagaceae bacterium]
MYEGYENQGMRCLRELVNQFGDINHIEVECDEFDVRLKSDTPDNSYDIYISTGGSWKPVRQ